MVPADSAIIAVRGGGDLGSACALRLARCGFRVVIAERAAPLAVRRTVSFCEAVYDGSSRVEEMAGTLITDARQAHQIWESDGVPVLVDPELSALAGLDPAVVVDARLLKRLDGGPERGSKLWATVALGPGHAAPGDVDAVVETNRGPNLGRVIWSGAAEENTHVPAPVAGHSEDRVLRAPVSGCVRGVADIGDIVEAGKPLIEIEGRFVVAPFRGLVRGLIRPGIEVPAGTKVGDLDPRLDPSLCVRVSDKALAVAGGAVEATFMLLMRSRSRES